MNEDDLRHQLIEKYDVDILTYKNPELVSKLADILLFPKYAFKSIMAPVILALVIFILSFSILELSSVLLIAYVLAGLLLWMFFGVACGLLYFFSKFNRDVRSMMKIGFELLARALNDIHQVNVSNHKESVKEIFQGVIKIALIPSVTEVVSERIPLFGSIINKSVSKILLNIGRSVKFDDTTFELPELGETRVRVSAIEKIEASSEKVLKNVFRVVMLPFKIMATITFISLMIFIALLH